MGVSLLNGIVMKRIPLIFAAAILSVAPVIGATPTVERSKLEKMAEAADTPKQHVEVAKQYRLQAEEFERKAAKHDAEARKLQTAPGNPMAQKWPAMVSRTPRKERQLAMEARRAAAECLEAAERHIQLSVEKLADAHDTRTTRSGGVD
jgi:hypothetical protein